MNINIVLKKKFFIILIAILFYLMPINSHAYIVTMFKPLGFIASAIADKVTSVEVIIPDGATIHNYSLRPLDMLKIKNSDFIISIGGNTEPFFLKKVIDHFKKKNIELSSLKQIKLFLIYNSTDLNETKKQKNTLNNNKLINNILYDMHIWLSPQIAIESAIIIHDMLIKIMPQKKTLIDNNLKQFKLNLLELNKNIKKRFLSIKEKKYFIFHDAYKYFEKYYKIYSLGYFKTYPGVQTGAKSLYEIKKELLKKKAVCIFSEPQFNTNIIDTIIRGTNIRKGILNPLGIKIPLSKESYFKFLLQLSNQYIGCLKTP